jgi:hypothetical protein
MLQGLLRHLGLDSGTRRMQQDARAKFAKAAVELDELRVRLRQSGEAACESSRKIRSITPSEFRLAKQPKTANE